MVQNRKQQTIFHKKICCRDILGSQNASASCTIWFSFWRQLRRSICICVNVKARGSVLNLKSFEWSKCLACDVPFAQCLLVFNSNVKTFIYLICILIVLEITSLTSTLMYFARFMTLEGAFLRKQLILANDYFRKKLHHRCLTSISSQYLY